MTSNLEHVATLAAILMDESHYCQSDAAFREAYWQRTGERYASAAPHIAARDALALIRAGKGVARWAEKACNGVDRWDAAAKRFYPDWTEADDASKDRADARALKKAQEIADRYGAIVKIGGDPRGYVFRLMLASARSNTFSTGDGWGVA